MRVGNKRRLPSSTMGGRGNAGRARGGGRRSGRPFRGSCVEDDVEGGMERRISLKGCVAKKGRRCSLERDSLERGRRGEGEGCTPLSRSTAHDGIPDLPFLLWRGSLDRLLAERSTARGRPPTDGICGHLSPSHSFGAHARVSNPAVGRPFPEEGRASTIGAELACSSERRCPPTPKRGSNRVPYPQTPPLWKAGVHPEGSPSTSHPRS